MTEQQNRKPLNRRMLRFANEYLTGVTGAEAVRRTGWKPKPNKDGSPFAPKQAAQQAANIASKYLRIPEVADYIRERRRELEESTGIRQERVLRRLNCIVEGTPKDLHDDTGKIVPIHEMTDEVAASVSEVEYETAEVKDATGKTTTARVVKRMKQHSPTQAAEQMARQLGWNKDSLELKAQLKVAAKPPVIVLEAYDDPDPEPDPVPAQPSAT